MEPTETTEKPTEAQPPQAPDPREAELSGLRSQLEQARAELAQKSQRLDEALRAYASQKNEQKEFRERLERERTRLIDVERGKVALALLEAGDELDRALKAAGEDSSPLAQGVRLIRESLGRKLSEMGIEPLVLLGKPFDPNQGEAVDLVAVADPAQDGVVVDEVTRGYTLSGKPLRPARVRVGKFTQAQA